MNIIAWFFAGLAAKSVFVTAQLIVATALVLAHIAMLGFFLYAIAFIYNKYNEFIALIVNLGTGDTLLATALELIKTMGIINAFNDVFTLFSPFIIGYLIYRAGEMVFHSWQVTSNEIFKVGVLTQQ